MNNLILKYYIYNSACVYAFDHNVGYKCEQDRSSRHLTAEC